MKGCKFDSWQEQQKKFSSPDISLCRLTGCPFHPRNNAVACKRPHSFCKKCRWQVTTNYAYTFDLIKSEWATSLFRHTVASRLSSLNHCGVILGIKKSGVGTRELFLTDIYKKKKKRPARECYVEPSLIILARQEKANISLSPPGSGFPDTLAEN